VCRLQKWLFLLCNCLKIIFFKDISDGLWADRIRDDGIDVVGSLHSIGSLASGDLSDDSMLSSGRELERTSSRRGLMIGKKLFEYSGYSRLTDTQIRSNRVSRLTIGGQGENVFFLSRGDGMHVELKGNKNNRTVYKCSIQGPSKAPFRNQGFY
jgi:hypothetical protein